MSEILKKILASKTIEVEKNKKQRSLKSLEDDDMFHYSPQPIIPMPDISKDDNPYKHIICDAAEAPKGSADDGTLKGTDLDNVYKDELI